jgi:dTDP-4-dehydrorhamnose 3,5-epimerase-like enzyme
MITTIKEVQLLKIPVVEDPRGNLAFVQNDILPFELKRVYYLFDVPSNSFRGSHSHINQSEVLIALSGSFEVVLNDGVEKKSFFLNKPNIGLYIPTGIWRELENFSSGAVCLVFASENYDEDDYIRDFDAFLISKK